MSLNLGKVSAFGLRGFCCSGQLNQNSRGKDVGDTKDELTLLDLGSEGDGWGVFGPDLLGGLKQVSTCMLCLVYTVRLTILSMS